MTTTKAKAKTIAPVAVNREAWLQSAVVPLGKLIERDTDLRLERDVAVSCGWPGGKSVNKVIGQCWPTGMCEGKAQVFVSPKLHDPVAVLACLLHELLHAADDCVHGHKGVFARAHKALGLGPKPTIALCDSEALSDELGLIAAELGEYPHLAIKPGARLAKVQTTRMLKVECPECGYVARATRTWLDVAPLVCGNKYEHANAELIEMEEAS
jgi:hypothetical protein